MYYKDHYGNVVEHSPDAYNGIHPGGVGYHPLTREDFSFTDVTSWFDKHKLCILLVLAIVVILGWYWNNRNKMSNKSASVFY
jgi:hypothetical protein